MPVAFLFFLVELALDGKPFPLLSLFFFTLTMNSSSSVSMILEIVVLGVERDVVVGMKAVVVSLVIVFFLTVIETVGPVVVVFMGAQVVVPGCLVGWLLGGLMRRYLGGGPGLLRRPELGQLCRAHSDLVRGLVERSQVFLGATVQVTVRERTLPPHVTGHCMGGRTQMIS